MRYKLIPILIGLGIAALYGAAMWAIRHPAPKPETPQSWRRAYCATAPRPNPICDAKRSQ